MKVFVSYSLNITCQNYETKSGYCNTVIELEERLKNFEQIMDLQRSIEGKLKDRYIYCQVVIISFQYLED